MPSQRPLIIGLMTLLFATSQRPAACVDVLVRRSRNTFV